MRSTSDDDRSISALASSLWSGSGSSRPDHKTENFQKEKRRESKYKRHFVVKPE
jgi:hypothetical protein